MPKISSSKKLSATREAKNLATRSSLRNVERMLMAATAASPDLTKGARASSSDTPMEEKRFEYPPVVDLMDSDEQPQQAPTQAPGGLETILQSIHNSIKKNELKLNLLTTAQEDSEDRLSAKLEDAMGKALGRLPSIVDEIVDKKLGAIAKDTNDKINSLQADIEEKNKKVLEEIKLLKKSAKAPVAAKDAKATADRLEGLEKSMGDLQRKRSEENKRPRPIIAEGEYDTARRSLALAPIPHTRGMGFDKQVKDVEMFLSKVLKVPEEVMELVGVDKVTRLTRGKEITDEALVCFNSASIRDTISSYGPNLAGQSAKMGMVVPSNLKEEERELEGIAWKLRSSRDGLKTRLRFDDGARGLKLMVRSPGQGKRWKPATKTQVQDAEKHVAKHGGRKRPREKDDETSPSANYVPMGRRRRQQSPPQNK